MTAAQTLQAVSVNNFSWSPNGNELAVFADNGVFIYDPDFQLQRYRELDKGAYGGWSPDGTHLVVEYQVWDATTLETLFELEVTPWGWLYGGTQIFSSSGTEIYIFDASNGNPVKTIKLDFRIESAPTTPDGTQLVSAFGSVISIIDIPSGKRVAKYVLPTFEGEPAFIEAYTLSPEGSRIAYVASTAVPSGTPGSTPLELQPELAILDSLYIMNLETGEILLTSEPLSDTPAFLSWEDSSTVTGISRTGTVYTWDATTLEMLSEEQLPMTYTRVDTVSFSRDGRYIAYSGESCTATIAKLSDYVGDKRIRGWRKFGSP